MLTYIIIYAIGALVSFFYHLLFISGIRDVTLKDFLLIILFSAASWLMVLITVCMDINEHIDCVVMKQRGTK